VATLSFEEARACVLRELSHAPKPPIEQVALPEALGRVLAEDAIADRDYPPSARSIRDGFAVRASDCPGELRITGETRAGEPSRVTVGPGEAVEIMTGAPMPAGANAVVMVEHVERIGETVRTTRRVAAGEFVNPRASEAVRGQVLYAAGGRISYAQIALLATLGVSRPLVYRKPRVAILATGDEIIEVESTPEPHQVRNSNAYSLAAQVERAGGIADVLEVARDTHASTRNAIQAGLERDLLLLSGGVSAGKYDVVEPVLAEFGAEFFFDRVLIQPGQPVVFGRACGRWFFGLPGNPLSTMVTFEIFARAALELLSGQSESALTVCWAQLTREYRHRPGLTRFLPARLEPGTGKVTPLAWQGSGDVAAAARANTFLIAEASREHWPAGDMIRVLLT
jgi:molybdopterin molybdotransferase